IQDWKNIGMSCDFSIFYSTINDHCRKISQWSFIDLYKKGLEYRKHAPIIFCPHCQTAIAQVEMEDKEDKSFLNYIKAKMEDGAYMIYATTRPEVLYGSVGMSIDKAGKYVRVSVNGEDWIISKDAIERLSKWFKLEVKEEFKGAKLIGKEITIPIAGNKVKITHDIVTDTKYGTGVVYYCTYGGFECVDWLTRHKDVEPINIMGLDGRYNNLNGRYKGMISREVRKEVIEDFDKLGVLIKQEPITHMVNVHERCGTDIEYVATEQWFIKVLDLKKQFLKNGSEMEWYPKHMKVRLDNWINGLKWDWCISRQRHYGVPFPIWYCKKCSEVILANEKDLPVDPIEDKPPVKKCPKCGHDKFIPEKDTLDTWATSSLTPQLAGELIKGSENYKKIYPMNLRAQAHDIITFWLFNTLVKSQLHFKINPWKHIMISGFALDPHGKKMSKSKGNVVHPQEMIEKYSADALRFWAAGSKLGDDLPFQEKDLVTGKKTTTKLWNASKFVLMHLQDYEVLPKSQKSQSDFSGHLEDYKYEKVELEILDKWLLTKLQKLVKKCTAYFEVYEYSKAKQEFEIFFWQIFTDNYLELAKDRLYNPDKYHKNARKSAQFVLYESLLNILKLIAPVMPHITEEIYQLGFSKNENCKSIHISKWPEYSESYVDKNAEEIGDKVVEIMQIVRKFKSEKSLSLKEELSSIIISCSASLRKNLELVLQDIKSITKSRDIEFNESKEFKIEINH
ncbi:MAG: class I tRNA ligase family protein, partial [Nanoarchaeota archaeon]